MWGRWVYHGDTMIRAWQLIQESYCWIVILSQDLAKKKAGYQFWFRKSSILGAIRELIVRVDEPGLVFTLWWFYQNEQLENPTF